MRAMTSVMVTHAGWGLGDGWSGGGAGWRGGLGGWGGDGGVGAGLGEVVWCDTVTVRSNGRVDDADGSGDGCRRAGTGCGVGAAGYGSVVCRGAAKWCPPAGPPGVLVWLNASMPAATSTVAATSAVPAAAGLSFALSICRVTGRPSTSGRAFRRE